MIAISPTFKPASRAKKILAVASGGGHWVELLRLMPAFEGAEVAFVTVNEEYRHDVEGHRFYVVNDATRWNKAAMALMAARLGGILLRERPDVVVTTGAAPGFFAIRLAKMVGARTVWLDSIANVDELSMSGQLAGKVADLWLTQWPHLASSNATRLPSETIHSREPLFAGAVL